MNNKSVVVFLLLNVILGAVLASFNVPILGWSSNDNSFPNNQDKFSQEEFKTLIQTIIKENRVETLTIYVEPKLRSDQLSTVFDSYSSDNNGGSFKNLKNSFEQSKSNVFIPYAESGVLSIISELKGIKGSIFVAKEADNKINIDGAKVISLNSNDVASTLSNKVVDIVVVVLGQNQDSTIKHFQSIVEKSSFVSFFTSESAQEFDVQSTYEKQIEEIQVELSHFKSNLQAASSASAPGSASASAPGSASASASPSPSPSSSSSSSSNGTTPHFTYVTGPVLSAYIVVAILLAIFITGCQCLTGIQTPERFETPKQKIL